jgi:hypothetical protein
MLPAAGASDSSANKVGYTVHVAVGEVMGLYESRGELLHVVCAKGEKS